ncbi:hypothetical protein JCM15765_03540 [Paradesulfitobacterium aromaticivorans]
MSKKISIGSIPSIVSFLSLVLYVLGTQANIYLYNPLAPSGTGIENIPLAIVKIALVCLVPTVIAALGQSVN